jgi:hypothetical protein
MRWERHVACMGERRGVYRVWWEDLKKEAYWKT